MSVRGCDGTGKVRHDVTPALSVCLSVCVSSYTLTFQSVAAVSPSSIIATLQSHEHSGRGRGGNFVFSQRGEVTRVIGVKRFDETVEIFSCAGRWSLSSRSDRMERLAGTKLKKNSLYELS